MFLGISRFANRFSASTSRLRDARTHAWFGIRHDRDKLRRGAKSELPEHFTMSVSQIVEETTEVVKNVSDW